MITDTQTTGYTLFERIAQELPVGTRLNPNYLVTGIRNSRNETALFYSIPGKTTGKRTQKSIVRTEFEDAFRHLASGGELTLDWFKTNLPITASQSTSCSFKVMGEVFVLLGLATRRPMKRGHLYTGVGRSRN